MQARDSKSFLENPKDDEYQRHPIESQRCKPSELILNLFSVLRQCFRTFCKHSRSLRRGGGGIANFLHTLQVFFAHGNARHCALLSLTGRGQLALWVFFSGCTFLSKPFSNPPAPLFNLFPLNPFFQLIQSQSIVVCQHNSGHST